MLTKKKLKKGVWYDHVLWEVEKVISPTEFDIYLLLKRNGTETIHLNGITPIIMILIDAYNDEFYFNTPKITDLMAKINKKEDEIYGIKQTLTTFWTGWVED